MILPFLYVLSFFVPVMQSPVPPLPLHFFFSSETEYLSHEADSLLIGMEPLVMCQHTGNHTIPL